MDLGLSGKRAIVTGASRGLGFATALGLANEGCHLAINSRSQERIEAAAEKIFTQTGGEVIPIPGDVTIPTDSEKIVSEATDSLGGLDIIITNSGGPPSGSIENIDDQTWQMAVELNFLSHMRLIRAALPLLRTSKSASVLTITSSSVKQPIPNLVLSNSIPAATVGLTKTLALELGGEGIRFNSILPAWIETERIYELMSDRAAINQTTPEEEIRRQSIASPLGRMGTTQEFANVAVFLVSPAASYVTGTMMTVDGGMYKGIY
jgi:3-oxoacyl-[acyl-carrier protein] reductase